MAKKKATTTKQTIDTLRHTDSRRTYIPTTEQQSMIETEEEYSIRVAYECNRDLDPQLVGRGKDEQDARPVADPDFTEIRALAAAINGLQRQQVATLDPVVQSLIHRRSRTTRISPERTRISRWEMDS